MPSPPEASMPGSGKFQSGPSQWNDMGHPHVGSGRWEPTPHPWLRGGPLPSQMSLPTSHLGPHVRLMNPGQSSIFHRPSEFQPVSNFGGLGHWRTPQFQPRPQFESEVER